MKTTEAMIRFIQREKATIECVHAYLWIVRTCYGVSSGKTVRSAIRAAMEKARRENLR